MNAIWKLLQSPEWWFTAVFIGLVIGIVAAYAKDFLSGLLSAVSKTYARRAARAKIARQRRIEVCVGDPSVLAVQYLRAILGLGLAFAGIVFSMLNRAWDVLRSHYPNVDLFNGVVPIPEPNSPASTFVSVALLLLSFPVYWSALRSLRECEAARRRLFRANV